MRMTSKGQVTIPAHIREAAGFHPGTDLAFEIDGDGEVHVRRSAVQTADPALTGAVARLRGAASAGLSTEEILALTRG